MSEDRMDAMELGPAEQEALEALLSAPPLTDGEWARLHASIVGAAAPALAARRAAALPGRASVAKHAWGGGRARRWLLPALPLAAAAALLLVLRSDSDAPARLGNAEAALLADVSEQEFHQLVSGHADAASLLLLAVQDDGED